MEYLITVDKNKANHFANIALNDGVEFYGTVTHESLTTFVVNPSDRRKVDEIADKMGLTETKGVMRHPGVRRHRFRFKSAVGRDDEKKGVHRDRNKERVLKRSKTRQTGRVTEKKDAIGQVGMAFKPGEIVPIKIDTKKALEHTARIKSKVDALEIELKKEQPIMVGVKKEFRSAASEFGLLELSLRDIFLEF